MADAQTTVARPQVRRLLVLMVCLMGLSVVVTRSREVKPPAPTGRSVPAEVRIMAPMRVGGAPLECQEVRLTRDRRGVRVYSKDASLYQRSDRNLRFWVDVQLVVDRVVLRGTADGALAGCTVTFVEAGTSLPS